VADAAMLDKLSLCDDQSCHAAMEGTMLYGDSNHLNREGSLFFSDKFDFQW
jgi:SGNH domain (fused to AT3 domains)